MKQNYIVFGVIVVILIIVIVIALNIPKKEKLGDIQTYSYNTYDESGKIISNELIYQETDAVTDVVKIDTDKGLIFVELDSKTAPITVKNFQNLVKSNFYTNMIFHRVIKDFMIQTGDPTGTGRGGSANTIKGEFKNNGVENNISHVRGVISMARNSQSMDSASSQFFIVHKDSTDLDGDYAAFGHVIAGLEVVDKIATVKTDSNDKPLTEIKLNSITFVRLVDTNE